MNKERILLHILNKAREIPHPTSIANGEVVSPKAVRELWRAIDMYDSAFPQKPKKPYRGSYNGRVLG